MLDWLERRFRRFAIPNLTMILIAGQVLVFIAATQDQTLLERMSLESAKVRGGEFYRLVSFLFIPPGLALIWAFFALYMFYMMGTALELFWGTFRYNVFLLIGYLANVAVAMMVPDGMASNWFLEGTVFLAFAWLNPNFVLHIFFVLAVRIKWLALITWIGFGFALVFSDISTKLTVVASVLNFLLFFGRDIWYRMRSGQRHMVNQARRFNEKQPAFFHRCKVCGITDTSHPHMDFRYCSKCSGDACYCRDHLQTHEHQLDQA